MGIVKHVALWLLLTSNIGLQVVGGTKVQNKDKESKIVETNVPTKTTGEEAVYDSSKTGKEDLSGKSTPSEPQINENKDVLDGTAVQKPGLLRRVSSKLPFIKSGSKSSNNNANAISTSDKEASDIPEVKGNGLNQDSQTETSSSESSTNNEKSLQGKKLSQRNQGKTKIRQGLKGTNKGTDLTKDSSSGESDDKKQKKKDGTDIHSKSLGEGQDKDSSSDSTDENGTPKHKEDKQKIDSSKDNHDTGVNEDKLEGLDDKNANTQPVTDHPEEEKKPAKKNSFLHRPHLPGPNIVRLLSRNKDKNQQS